MPINEKTGEKIENNLPGGPLIEQVLQARIERGERLAALYIDLTNFEAYTCEYGWNKGDAVIKMLATIIIESVREVGGKEDCTGHIDGDDFVVISTPDRAANIAQQIIKRFDLGIAEYYSPEARERHYVDGLDRRGNPYRALLASVAIAIVTNEHRELEHPLQVAELAMELKKFIKLWPGSQFAFDHRHK